MTIVSPRRLTGATVAAAALLASVLVAQPAAAAPLPTSAKPSLSTAADWTQWVDPSNYDYAFVAGPHGTHPPSLRMSNAVDTAQFGNIQQLSGPAISAVGEPGSGAAHRVFTADFTVDAQSYLAQPGLAVEIAPSQGGNRAGGDLVLRHDADNELTLTNYYLPASAPTEDDSEWRNVTVKVPFTAPVNIRYVVEFNAAAPDIVRVYVNNELKISSGGSFERYHELDGAALQSVDTLLFRTNKNVPVDGGGWTRVEPTAPEKAALDGKGFYFSGIEYGASNVALAPASTLTVQPSVTGTLVVGGTLTASVATNVINPTLAYQWLRGGIAISGAKSSTYTIAANDAGKQISLKVTASKTGYGTVIVTTPKSAAVSTATLTFSSPAAISGTAKLGATLTASGATTPGATYTYQWYRNGAAIKNAAAKTYKVGASDVNRTLTVKVTAAKGGYATLSSTSAPTATVLPGTLVVGVATISGTTKVGSTLSARAGTWTSGTTLKYAFYADSELVQLSTNRKFKLTWEEKGKRITVIVLGSKPGYESAESNETAPRGPVA
ncbi:MAG TPA: hypothetical protein VNR36_12460 [Pseudolysinimonas sp.]|nr:hypothetical protein [Pseudolysinimonas sp.]